MVELTLELGIVIAAWVVSLFVAVFAVPRLVAPRARKAWTDWLMSDDAKPYMDRLAERVEVRMEPRLNAFEERLNEPVQIDLEPIVAMVTDSLTPRLREEVDRVRAFIDGKIGYVRKIGKNMGEAVAEVTGEAVAQEAAGGAIESELFGELDGMLNDAEWVQSHKVAAFGLRLLKREVEGGGRGVTGRRTGYRPGYARR